MEKNNYLISEMKIEDLENIKDILEVDFDEFWNYETLKEELESNFSKYFIAKQNDNIVGFAGLKIILDEADLMNIVTKKCCRHEGIASNIMDKLIEYCKQEKIKCINLEVNIQNSIAINFYKKYNFKEVGLRKKYYDNTYDAISPAIKLIIAITAEHIVTLKKLLYTLIDVREGNIIKLEISIAPIIFTPITTVTAVKIEINVL